MLGGEAAAELFGFGGVKELARWGLSGTGGCRLEEGAASH